MATTAARTVLVLTLLGAAIGGLTACTTDGPAVEPTTSATPSAPETAEPSPTEEPSETATPTPSATPTADAGSPIALSCDQLVSAQQMYEYNSNFSLSDDYAPKAGSRAATAVEYQGLACEWVNDSSGDKIDIAVAKVSPATIESLKATAASAGTTTTRFGVDGYFATSGNRGLADAFSGDYWIVADSEFFAEAADADFLVKAAIAALP